MTSDSRLQTPDFDASLMRRALELASRGVGRVSPSPLVGCVIAREDRIVGEGFFVYEQVIHAERQALEQAGRLTSRLNRTLIIRARRPAPKR